ncbi:hypothetical protein QYE76_043031 [Lolium multiflorum]|uniref:Uncharacterized protein n=1 Tax=Lolium multiflorum TaxID=4521 RepID=A0AAD8THZ4_LOLMU|nr:hypothetical protein QYE76_043031 [Lolium multiflorum]
MEEAREDDRMLMEDPIGGRQSTPSLGAQPVQLDGSGGTPIPTREEAVAPPNTTSGAAVDLLPIFAPRVLVGHVAARADALIQEADRLFEEMSRASQDLSWGTSQVVGVVVLGASNAQAAAQSILRDARREAAAILERARHQAKDALSAAYYQADNFLGGTLIPEASGLLVCESAMALCEREVEVDRLSIPEREHALEKEANLTSQETAVALWEAEAARELGSSWRPASSDLRDLMPEFPNGSRRSATAPPSSLLMSARRCMRSTSSARFSVRPLH